MSHMPQPRHLMTLDDWVALPEDEGYRLEVVEGILIMAPPPMPFHQRAVFRLGYLIDEQLPDRLSALIASEVVLADDPLTVRVPDVLLTDASLVASNPPRFTGEDVRLAVEVLSDGTRRTDRVTKFAEYAEVGIGHYWIVDLDPPTTLTAFRLVDDAYERAGEHTGVATLEVADAPITLDLGALTTPKAQRLQP
jgi:Uma2 family endonuclease